MRHKDGGPAFPRPAFAPDGVGYEDCGITEEQDGMSLRDWFAGMALQGMLAGLNEGESYCRRESRPPLDHFQGAAKTAYEHADAMLVARTASLHGLGGVASVDLPSPDTGGE